MDTAAVEVPAVPTEPVDSIDLLDDVPVVDTVVMEPVVENPLDFSSGTPTSSGIAPTDTPGMAPSTSLVAPTQMPNLSAAETQDSGNTAAATVNQPAPAMTSDASLSVRVDAPEKRAGVNKLGFSSTHMTYAVTMSTTDAAFWGASTVTVRRRFNDFVSLHKTLHKTLRGCFLPALPDKTLLGVEARLMKDDFIAMRIVDLNKYCAFLCAHPDVRTSKPFKVFLTETTEDLATCPTWRELAASTSVLDALKAKLQPGTSGPAPPQSSGIGGAAAALGGKLFRKMKELKMQAQQEVGVRRALPELTTEEIALRDTKKALDEQLSCFRASSLAAEAYVHALAEMSQVSAELGAAFATLARTEEGCGAACGAYTEAGRSGQARAADFQKVGYAGLKLTDLYKKYAQATAGALMPVQDYFANLPEGIHALEEREHAYMTTKMCETELAMKRARSPHLAAAQAPAPAMTDGTPGPSPGEGGTGGPGGVGVLDEVGNLEQQLAKAKAEYEKIMANNNTELARLKAAKSEDLGVMLVRFANAQAQLQVALSSQWMNISDQLSME